MQAGLKLLFLGELFLLFLLKQPLLPEELFSLRSLSEKEVFISKHMETLQELNLSHFPCTASVWLALLASGLYFSGISLY